MYIVSLSQLYFVLPDEIPILQSQCLDLKSESKIWAVYKLESNVFLESHHKLNVFFMETIIQLTLVF